MKNYNLLLISLSVFLTLLNAFLLTEFEPAVHRWGRVISTLLFLALFLKHFHKKKILLLGAFLLLLLADLFALTYQKAVSQQAFFAFQSLAYLLLIFHIGRYLVGHKLRTLQIIYFSLVFILNTFFIVVIGDLLAEEVRHPIVEALFYVYGFSAIIFISSGILYYDRYPNTISASFLIAVAGLVLSNLMGFPAHFMQFWEFFYLDRLFYVVGTAGLVSYSYYTGNGFSLVLRKSSRHQEQNEDSKSSQDDIDKYEEEHHYL